MTERSELEVIDRRAFLLSTAALAAFLPMSGAVLAEQKVTWKDAMTALVGNTEPAEGKVSLDLPEIAENGNTVPFTVSVDSPMTEGDYVKSVHVFATGNPRPDVASFYFSPQSGKAEATTRMRLGQTQDVVAVAEMSDGNFYFGRRTVKVTIGGCGG